MCFGVHGLICDKLGLQLPSAAYLEETTLKRFATELIMGNLCATFPFEPYFFHRYTPT